MKQLTLDEQAKLFIDSDNSFDTTNDFCELMDIQSNINVKKGTVEDAMAEEEESKNVLSSATKNEADGGEDVVASVVFARRNLVEHSDLVRRWMIFWRS